MNSCDHYNYVKTKAYVDSLKNVFANVCLLSFTTFMETRLEIHLIIVPCVRLTSEILAFVFFLTDLQMLFLLYYVLSESFLDSQINPTGIVYFDLNILQWILGCFGMSDLSFWFSYFVLLWLDANDVIHEAHDYLQGLNDVILDLWSPSSLQSLVYEMLKLSTC